MKNCENCDKKRKLNNIYFEIGEPSEAWCLSCIRNYKKDSRTLAIKAIKE